MSDLHSAFYAAVMVGISALGLIAGLLLALICFYRR